MQSMPGAVQHDQVVHRQARQARGDQPGRFVRSVDGREDLALTDLLPRRVLALENLHNAVGGQHGQLRSMALLPQEIAQGDSSNCPGKAETIQLGRLDRCAPNVVEAQPPVPAVDDEQLVVCRHREIDRVVIVQSAQGEIGGRSRNRHHLGLAAQCAVGPFEHEQGCVALSADGHDEIRQSVRAVDLAR